MAFQVMKRTLYNGKYEMVHNPNARGRSPRYLVNGDVKPKGVTTILNKTLSKDLMKWAVDCCVGYLQSKMPIITQEDLDLAAVEYERLRDAGGSTGSKVHELVEHYLNSLRAGESFVPPIDVMSEPEVMNAFGAVVQWVENTNPVILGAEENIYSAQYNYAGTYDALVEIDGKVYLSDFKTTNPSRKAPAGIYAENFIQLGAYAQAHNEQREYEEKNGGTSLVKIDDLMLISAKKNGALDVVCASDLGLTVDDCMQLFIFVVSIHNFLSDTTAKLGGK